MGGFNLSACFIVESQFGTRVFLTRVRAVAWAERKAKELDTKHFVYRQDLGWEGGEATDGSFAWAAPTLIQECNP